MPAIKIFSSIFSCLFFVSAAASCTIDSIDTSLILSANRPNVVVSSAGDYTIRITQVHVAQQEGWSCGYHALKNGIFLANALCKQTRKECNDCLVNLNSETAANQLFGYHPVGVWREHVLSNFELCMSSFDQTPQTGYTDIDGDSVYSQALIMHKDSLYNCELREEVFGRQGLLFAAHDQVFACTASLPYYHLYPPIFALAQALRSGKKAIVLCNQGDHWFCLGAYRHGNVIEGIIADSDFNTDRCTDLLVSDLLKIATTVM